jgi:hypothetical protein
VTRRITTLSSTPSRRTRGTAHSRSARPSARSRSKFDSMTGHTGCSRWRWATLRTAHGQLGLSTTRTQRNSPSSRAPLCGRRRTHRLPERGSRALLAISWSMPSGSFNSALHASQGPIPLAGCRVPAVSALQVRQLDLTTEPTVHIEGGGCVPVLGQFRERLSVTVWQRAAQLHVDPHRGIFMGRLLPTRTRSVRLRQLRQPRQCLPGAIEPNLLSSLCCKHAAISWHTERIEQEFMPMQRG